MAVRERLDRNTALSRSYTTMRPFIYEGRSFEKGEAFPTQSLSFHTVQTLHGSRYIDLVPAEAQAPDEQQGVTLTQKPGGNYEITAAWLAEPVKAKGKANAEAEAARIREEGPPLGFIDGGSEVTIEDQGGGWYLVSAPWLPAPEKVQGRLLAEQRQREIHAAGPPADWKPSEPLKAGDVVTVGPEGGDLAGLKATIEKIDGENADIVSFASGGASDGSDLKHGTVALSVLTLAEPESQA